MKNKPLFPIAVYSVIFIFIGFVAGYFIYPLFIGGSPILITLIPTPISSSTDSPDKPDDQKIFETGSRWELYADYMKYNKNTKEGIIHNITCCYYEGNSEQLIIESEKAEVDLNKDTIVFNSRVRAVSVNGEILEVDKLIWNRQDNSAFGEGNVRLLKEETLVKSEKIEADLLLKTYDLSGKVEMIKSKGRRIENELDQI